MKIPGHKPGPCDYWLAAAFTEFVNGCLAGIGGGSVVGAGVGITTTTTTIGATMSPLMHIIVTVGSMILTASGNGVKRVVVWHNSNPFPNPWPAPTSDTPSS